MGLLVYWPYDAARDAGLRGGDLIVAVDGRTDMRFEGDLLKYLHLDNPEMKSVELTYIREGVKSKLTLPLRYPQLSAK
jgi:S1-C subfamily serine protease